VVARCPSGGSDGPKRCAPQAGFSIIDTKTDLSDFRLVVNEELGFQVFLEPAGCNEVRYEAPLQWRSFDNQPFAVIQAAKCSDTNHAVKETKPKAARTVVVVRGLAGFEALHQEFDATKNRNAHRDATLAADKFLNTVWPKIEQQRSATAALEKQQATDSDAEDVEDNAPVPAAEKRSKARGGR